MEVQLNDDIYIRSFLYGDASGLARHGDNPNIAINQRESFPHPYTIEHARNWIQFIKENEVKTRFVIATKNEAIGEIGVVIQPDVHLYSAEIGFWVGENFWGQGIMTQAVSWMMDYCFKELGLRRVFADVIEYNLASQKVLQKCGFQLEGLFRDNVFKNDEFHNQLVFARLSSDDSQQQH